MKLVADTSAIVAVLREENDWQYLLQTLEQSEVSISAASLLECSIVLQRGTVAASLQALERLLERLAVVIVPVDEAQARLAAAAYATYGKGRHPAALNFGDCFSYALAKHLDQPLLYKGDDFAQTDLPSALPA